ncbi:chemotaxis protein CheW [Marinimicrobium alkaliphilum]|uniref:chemotaxis protein CheW n=1 Tax=Marinimicrobium alkaliphilum TaxID=2202654 RepID=UPI001E5514F9|nr:chemotaxis protein CheW [Marinimicrobium alkaliphilum]
MSDNRYSEPLLQTYLDELLTDAPPDESEPLLAQREQLQKLLFSARPGLRVPAPELSPAPEAPPEVIPKVKEIVPEPTTVYVPPVAPKSVPRAPVSVPAPPEVAAAQEPILERSEALAEVAVEGVDWLENGRPPWAQRDFDVLLFDVSGLTLAVPLVALGQIQPITDELTPLFGQAEWFMGLQPTPAGKVRTVNTARFVMPERYDERFEETAKYVVSINGVPWGLAVDSVKQPIRLAPEDVKWRSERSKRPWLAGTVKAHMCALLDIPRIGHLLTQADRNTKRA